MNTPDPQAESIHGWMFDEAIENLEAAIMETKAPSIIDIDNLLGAYRYLIERCRRAEAKIVTLEDDLLQARRTAEGLADSHAILDSPDDESIEYRLEMRIKNDPLPWEVKP